MRAEHRAGLVLGSDPSAENLAGSIEDADVMQLVAEIQTNHAGRDAGNDGGRAW